MRLPVAQDGDGPVHTRVSPRSHPIAKCQSPVCYRTPRGRDPPYPDSLLVDSGQDPNARPPCTPSVESVLRYRHELIERFRNIVCSSATLPPYADDLIGSIHAFVLAHQYPAPTALVADTGYIAPWKLLSDPAPVRN